ncbi:hypothetical protein [Legionella sainthelensi]|nr:hypothetical protein [Legionella sainthelensi]
MRKIRGVLKRRYTNGRTNRQIVNSVGINACTVSTYFPVRKFLA